MSAKTFRVVPLAGEPYEVTVLPVDLLLAERMLSTRKAGQVEQGMSYVYQSAVRLGHANGSFEDWAASLGDFDRVDEVAEPDPTQPAPGAD
jgi:hypothetical protein